MGLTYLDTENTGSQLFITEKCLVSTIWKPKILGCSSLEPENMGSQLFRARKNWVTAI